MLYMVIEHFREGCVADIYHRFQTRGRLLPEGLDYVSSWTETGFGRCFQLMHTHDPALFEQWTAHWNDLVDFEIQPVFTSAQAAQTIAPQLLDGKPVR